MDQVMHHTPHIQGDHVFSPTDLYRFKIVGSLPGREVAYWASDRHGSSLNPLHPRPSDSYHEVLQWIFRAQKQRHIIQL